MYPFERLLSKQKIRTCFFFVATNVLLF